MIIGIRTGCLRTNWTDGLERAAELGFDCLEPDIGPDPEALPLWKEDDLRQLRQTMDSTGCTIDSVCIGGLWKISPASDDEAIRRQAVDLMKETAPAAARIGATWILLPITPGGPDDDPETSVSRWIAAVREAAPVAQEAGVTFCLENVGRGCGRSAAELIRLVDAVDSPAVKIYYDMGNAVLFGFDPLAEIIELGDRIAIVHVKDHADRLGHGDVPVAEVIRFLAGRGYDDHLIFETTPTGNPTQAAAYNLGYVKGVLDCID